MTSNLGLLLLSGLLFAGGLLLFFMVRIFPGDRAMATSKNPPSSYARIRADYWIFFGLGIFFIFAFIIFSFDLYKFIPSFLLIQ